MSEKSYLVPDSQNDILQNYIAITSQIHVEGRIDEMRSSPIRRTFCLIVLLDLVLCLLVWIVRIEISNNQNPVTFRSEVVEYKFNSSLFDTVLLASVRFVFLEVMYGAVKSMVPWWVAVSTSVSSIFTLVKLLVSYSQNHYNSIDLTYCIVIIVTFLLCWVETIFIVCRVLPKERAALEVSNYQRSLSEQVAISSQSITSTIPVGSGYDSRLSTSPPSGDDIFFSPIPTRPGSPSQIRKQGIHIMAHNLHEKSLEIVRNTVGWTHVAGDAVQGCVSYKEISSYHGKLFKIEVLLDASAHNLFNDVVHNCEQSPEWNPHARSVKKIEIISDRIDILYNVTNDALKGYIKPRDFVLLRTWKSVSKGYLISMTSIVHDNYPPQPDIVRGEYGIGAVYIESMTDDSEQCKYTMITNSDIKGNVFRSVVDRSMPGILLEIVDGLRKHCATLRCAA